MRSAGTIKLALWREKKKLNPTPKLPKYYEDIIDSVLPKEFTQTNDKGDFLILQSWTSEAKEGGLLVYLSDFGADILKRHSLWLLDGTFNQRQHPSSR